MTYVCGYCSKTFDRKIKFDKHKRTHKGKCPSKRPVRWDPDYRPCFQCKICDRFFSQKWSLQAHMLIHQKSPGHNTQIDTRTATRNTSDSILSYEATTDNASNSGQDKETKLVTIIAMQNTNEPYIIYTANTDSANKSAKEIDTNTAKQNTYKSDGANRLVKDEETEIDTNTAEQNTYKSDGANRSVKDEETEIDTNTAEKSKIDASSVEQNTNKTNKIKADDNRIKSEEGQAFVECRDHLYHRSPTIYSCRYCSMTFARKSVLDDHQGIHTGRLPYKCKICATSFTRKSSLTAHLKSLVHKTNVLEAATAEQNTSKSNLNYAANTDNTNKSEKDMTTKLDLNTTQLKTNKSNENYVDTNNATKSAEEKESKLGSIAQEHNMNKSYKSYNADQNRVKTEEELAFVDLLNL